MEIENRNIEYINNLAKMLLGIGIFAIGLCYWVLSAGYPDWLYIIIPAYLVISGYYAYQNTFQGILIKFKKENEDIAARIKTTEKEKELAVYDENLWKRTLREKTSGFPSLLDNIDYFESLRDEAVAGSLITKSHPAFKASEVVKEETRRRREAERDKKQTLGIIEYYENIAPFLLDFKNEMFNENELKDTEPYTEEEGQDPITNFLTIDEYRKLSSVERNQRALERFWNRPNKPKWLIGRLYERYVGYEYEKNGYDVEYHGIFKGYEDLGRDLICRKGDEFIVIQCKRWSQFKTIFEKHIFQFFGTVFEYQDANPDKKVKGVFYTTTKLSDLARKFANKLNIQLVENHIFDEGYPCIKCNIGVGGKIYHLPFDQQYDTVKIEPNKGEFYCATVQEAEDAGFRRAYRFQGLKENK